MVKKSYCVVTEAGSYLPSSKCTPESNNCGHKHRTIQAAEKCLIKKTRAYCIHGTIQGNRCSQCTSGIADNNYTSANWYGARIHDDKQCRVEPDE